MTEIDVSINQTVCKIAQIDYLLLETDCDRCKQPANFFNTAERMAIDIHLDHPVLLQIRVSVHHCLACRHYFRAQPPFLRPDAIYTNLVVRKAVQAVYEDRMAMRRVPDRLARDFWVQPSEGSVRAWCRDYSANFDFDGDYQPWVVAEFSGILCVDEVYQDRLALLLAVDPAAPDGDRLIGYRLVHGSVEAGDVECFFNHLKAIGLDPDQVITDGSQLYPAVLAKVWPQAAHQLCLFHETRRLTKAVMKVINDIRKKLPHPPPASSTMGGGPLRDHPPQADATHPATQRWYWRQLRRRAQIIEVHRLAEQGFSQRAIARQTGHHRQTVKRWLAKPVPELPADMPADLSDVASASVKDQRRVKKQQLKLQVHALAAEGQSYSAIARRVGVHRLTVKKWLHQEPPAPEEPVSPPEPEPQDEPLPPPAPWSDWAQVRQVREMLQEHRYLLLRRLEKLNAEEQALVETLLVSPVGAELQVARSFLVDWYQLWSDDEVGQRRSLAEAEQHYDAWRTNPTYRSVAHLRRVLDQMTESKFEPLSQFLRHPDWEATNNGAERTGRAFRHRQAPHFNLRKPETIENAINVAACLRKAQVSRPQSQPFHTCQRGRRPKQLPLAV